MTANFARRIACPVLIGLACTTNRSHHRRAFSRSPINRPPKETVILPRSGHNDENGSQSAYNSLLRHVAAALRQGQAAPVADRRSPRSRQLQRRARGTVMLEATSTDSSAIYRWRRNGGALPDATASSSSWPSPWRMPTLHRRRDRQRGRGESQPAIVGLLSS